VNPAREILPWVFNHRAPPAPGGIDLGLLCLLMWVLAGLALLGAAVFRDALRTWPSGP